MNEFIAKENKINEYECKSCKEAKIEHKVVWIGHPSKCYRKCSNCGFMDGPWVEFGYRPYDYY